nr:MsnO8 family LLM class oxidoreductase [Halotalea alkalilenta]
MDALYPGRIDLGLGRAPGGDGRVIRALRRTLESDPNTFPSDVAELRSYFADDGQTGVVAMPGAGAKPQIWILGSSLNGAMLAAALGLRFAFASHFAPDVLDQALSTYRREFRPSALLADPYAAAGLNVYAADSDEEAELIASSQQQFSVEPSRPCWLNSRVKQAMRWNCDIYDVFWQLLKNSTLLGPRSGFTLNSRRFRVPLRNWKKNWA